MYQCRVHGIGMMKMQDKANSQVRHSTPQPEATKLNCSLEPSTCRQSQRFIAVITQAQPMMVIADIDNRTNQPNSGQKPPVNCSGAVRPSHVRLVRNQRMMMN
jgi:hypothetical protein